MLRLFLLAIVLLLISGCASYGVVENAPQKAISPDTGYSLESFQEFWRSDDNSIMLAFSGAVQPGGGENYPGCGSELPDWLKAAHKRTAQDPELAMVSGKLPEQGGAIQGGPVKMEL